MAISLARAARDTGRGAPTGTSNDIGPGTYSNTHNEPVPPPGETAVPFSSLEEKVLNPNGSTSAFTPGPGAYTAAKQEPQSVGHTSFQSKMARMGPTAPGSSVYMPSTIEKNPGPGTYKVQNGDIQPKGQKTLVKPLKPVLEAADKTTPSIPIRRLLPGTQQDTTEVDSEMAAVVMRHTGEPQDLVGPGEYNPAGDNIVLTTARHTTFYASKLNRNLWEPTVEIGSMCPSRDNPGPGNYEQGPGMGDLPGEDALNSYQFTSRSAMAHQIETREDRILPGPGRYEIAGPIEASAKVASVRSAQLGDRSRFGTMVARNGWNRDLDQPYTDPFHVHHVPGPGHYPSPLSSFPDDGKRKEAEKALPQSARKKIHGVHHPTIIMALQEAQGPLQAFNSTDDRPCNKAKEQITPSPFEYNPAEMRGNSMTAVMKERLKVGRKGVFGTCADRFYRSPLAGRAGLPDPSDYAEPQNDAYNEPRSMFQSSSPRIADISGPREPGPVKVGNFQTPAPGAYQTEHEPNYRSPFRHPRTAHLSFGSCAHRFSDNRDVFVEHMPSASNPGPGDYSSGKKSKITGAAVVKSNRPGASVGSTTETVGPGSYDGEVMETTTLLKKTFNETLGARSSKGRVAKGHVL